MLMGDPPRKLVKLALRAVVHPLAKVRYLALYDMNRNSEAVCAAFLARVAREMRRSEPLTGDRIRPSYRPTCLLFRSLSSWGSTTAGRSRTGSPRRPTPTACGPAAGWPGSSSIPARKACSRPSTTSDGLSMSDLAAALGVQPPTVTKMISRLAAQDYVERRASPATAARRRSSSPSAAATPSP